jgi:hypothetical protein
MIDNTMVDYNFLITGPLELEESFQDRIILSGVVLKLDSETKNGRIYQIEEADQIAQDLVGMPVFFGVKPPHLINTPQGLAVQKGKHDKDLNDLPSSIGRVFKTIHDKANKTIKAWIEVWNNQKYPDLVQRIKTGWGFSIGGLAQDLKDTGMINAIGKVVKKVFGMKPNHLQLLEPDTPRGQDDAKVDDIKAVEETFNFDPCPWGACEVQIPVTTIEESVPKMSSPITIIRTTKRVIYLLDADSFVS